MVQEARVCRPASFVDVAVQVVGCWEVGQVAVMDRTAGCVCRLQGRRSRCRVFVVVGVVAVELRVRSFAVAWEVFAAQAMACLVVVDSSASREVQRRRDLPPAV